MDYRTPTEQTIHTLLEEVLQSFSRQKIGKFDFYACMGKLRDAKKMLDFKQGGCPMGAHSVDCLCSDRVVYLPQTLKRKKAK